MLIKTQEEIRALQELGKLHAEVISELEAAVRPGVNTAELEEIACKRIAALGCVPAFKNYRPHGAERPFPCALCVAPNDVVVHGIPTELAYTLKDGDILGLDVGVMRGGLVIDAGKTVPVGTIDAKARNLLAVTLEALMHGIGEAWSGNHIGDIGYAVESYVRSEGYGIVRDLCGHGVGHAVHEEPQVPNYGARGKGERLVPGMVLAIEPMVNEGKGAVEFTSDGYTVRTKDGSRSAHFEHNIAITHAAPLILTCW
ncbi:MAG: type I methionyl aminopeptidase [Candidatus Pacebacteria bacterium]|nr:type I methionyl aminopeptidase [Candidatus Paceibacterota bacterium]